MGHPKTNWAALCGVHDGCLGCVQRCCDGCDDVLRRRHTQRLGCEGITKVTAHAGQLATTVVPDTDKACKQAGDQAGLHAAALSPPLCRCLPAPGDTGR